MKKTTVVLMLMLLALVVLMGLSACRKPMPPLETPDPPEEELTDNAFFLDDPSVYTIVRSDEKVVRLKAVELRDLLGELYEIKPEIAEDWVDSSESPETTAARKEILIGVVDRPESEAAAAQLLGSGFTVQVSGNKLILCGVTPEDTVKAIDYLISTLLYNKEGKPVQGIKEDFMFRHSYHPTIAETSYLQDDLVLANVVVTNWPYLADSTGKTDATAAIQTALDDLAVRGGGTVFLPAGQYLVKGSLHVPRGCLLKGDYQDPEVENPAYGTVILADPNPLDEKYLADRTRSPLITLSSNCGVDGLTVYYPKQSMEDVIPYGYTVYAHKPACVTIANLTLLNSYRGVGVDVHADASHEMAQMDNLHMTVLETGIEIYDSTDVGYTTNISITPDYWAKASGSFACADADALYNYCRKNTVAMQFNGLDDTHFSNLYLAGVRTAIYLPAGYTNHDFWGLIYDLTIEDCDYGIVIESLNPSGGAAIAKASIDASKFAIYSSASTGALKLAGIELTGKGKIVAVDRARIYEDSVVDLPDYEIRKATYKQPAANLYIPDILTLSEKKKDISAIVQATLDEAGKTGGVVYLPAGIYSLYKPLNVPAGVELRGAVPLFMCDSSWESITGTVLLTYVKDTATITLGEGAGVNGLRLFTAMTSPSEAITLLEKNDPITVNQVGIKGKGKGVYAHNVVVTNLFNGVDFSGCDDHSVLQLYGSVWNDFIISGGTGGTIERCLNNEHFSYRQHFMSDGYMDSNYYSGWQVDMLQLRNELRRVWGDTVRLVDAEDVCISNVFAYGQAALVCSENSSGVLLNLSSDFHGMRAQIDVRDKSDLVAINLLRSANESISCEESASLKAYNRIAICRFAEPDFDSDDDHIDQVEYTNIRDVLMLNDGSIAATNTTLHRGDYTKTDGTSLYHAATAASVGTNAQLFSQSFSGIDVTKYATSDNGYLHLWVYVEDMSSSMWTGWITLSTAGGSLSWSSIAYITHDGWNELWLPMRSGQGVGSGALIFLAISDIRGGADQHSDYYFDDIYLCLADSADRRPMAVVNAELPAAKPKQDIPSLPVDRTGLFTGDSLKGLMYPGRITTAEGTFKQGSGALQIDTMLNPAVQINFSAKNLTPYMKDGYIHLWFYIEDVSAMKQACLELTSSGTCDRQEIYWWINGRVKNGWNELMLPLSSPDGRTDVDGAFDPGRCNYIRLYMFLSRPTLSRLDDVRVMLEDGADDPFAPDEEVPEQEIFTFTVFEASETPYLSGNAHKNDVCRFTDGTAELIYSYQIRDFSRLTSAVWKASTSGQLKLEVSTDGSNWEEVYCYQGSAGDKGLGRQTRTYDLTAHITEKSAMKGTLYVRITDAYPTGGFGGAVSKEAPTILTVEYDD